MSQFQMEIKIKYKTRIPKINLVSLFKRLKHAHVCIFTTCIMLLNSIWENIVQFLRPLAIYQKGFIANRKRIPSFILFDSTPVSKYMFKGFHFFFCGIIYFALWLPFKMNRVFSSAFSCRDFGWFRWVLGFLNIWWHGSLRGFVRDERIVLWRSK